MVRQTRGKTKPNRHSLWLTWFAEQYHQREPFRDRSIIDLGYGEKPYSVLELYEASRGFESPPSIIGVESAAHRHQQALAERHSEISFILDENVDFSRYRSPPKLIRALNVLRQYPPQEVASIRQDWLSTSPGDVLLTEGTTDRDGDTLAMWCQSHEAPSTLVFGVTGRRGFAPISSERCFPMTFAGFTPNLCGLSDSLGTGRSLGLQPIRPRGRFVDLPKVSNGSTCVTLPGYAPPQPSGRADWSSSVSTIS